MNKKDDRDETQKIRTCEICGKEFTIKSGSQIYCSDMCYAKSQEKKFKEERKKPKQQKKILTINDVLKIGRKYNIVGYSNIVKFIEEQGIKA